MKNDFYSSLLENDRLRNLLDIKNDNQELNIFFQKLYFLSILRFQ